MLWGVLQAMTQHPSICQRKCTGPLSCFDYKPTENHRFLQISSKFKKAPYLCVQALAWTSSSLSLSSSMTGWGCWGHGWLSLAERSETMIQLSEVTLSQKRGFICNEYIEYMKVANPSLFQWHLLKTETAPSRVVPLFSFGLFRPFRPFGLQGGPASAEECPHLFHSFPLHCWGNLSLEVMELQWFVGENGNSARTWWVFHSDERLHIMEISKVTTGTPKQSRSYS